MRGLNKSKKVSEPPEHKRPLANQLIGGVYFRNITPPIQQLLYALYRLLTVKIITRWLGHRLGNVLYSRRLDWALVEQDKPETLDVVLEKKR